MGCRARFVSAEDAVAKIRDGDTVVVEGGSGGFADAERLVLALEERYLRTGSPKDLTIYHPNGLGDGIDRSINHLAHRGLVKRFIGGHFGLLPAVAKMILGNEVEAYNFPQGVLAQLLREIARRGPGLVTKVGLGTFVDPRFGGGKLNDVTKDDLVTLICIEGEEYLFYRAVPVHVALVRGSMADEYGNISYEHECATFEGISACQAARACGGIVIAQVKRVVKWGTLDPKLVKIPRTLVDYVVVDEQQWQSYRSEFDGALSGQFRLARVQGALPSGDVKAVIARRAVRELAPGMVANVGYGTSAFVVQAALEAGLFEDVVFVIEQGIVGGMPLPGVLFGCAANPEAIIDQPYQFDLFHGGGLDIAFLSFAECDAKGNVNASRFDDHLAGAGGFIDISQHARKVVFCGTFTAAGLSVGINDGSLKILSEGRIRKFVPQVQQVTFSGERALRQGQQVVVVTERAVLELTPGGWVVTEVAPGVDLEQDVLRRMGFQCTVRRPVRCMNSTLFR
ncbi:MAG: CoA-transferase [Bacillota bacterium]